MQSVEKKLNHFRSKIYLAFWINESIFTKSKKNKNKIVFRKQKILVLKCLKVLEIFNLILNLMTDVNISRMPLCVLSWVILCDL